MFLSFLGSLYKLLSLESATKTFEHEVLATDCLLSSSLRTLFFTESFEIISSKAYLQRNILKTFQESSKVPRNHKPCPYLKTCWVIPKTHLSDPPTEFPPDTSAQSISWSSTSYYHQSSEHITVPTSSTKNEHLSQSHYNAKDCHLSTTLSVHIFGDAITSPHHPSFYLASFP